LTEAVGTGGDSAGGRRQLRPCAVRILCRITRICGTRNFKSALAAGAVVIDFTGKVWTKDESQLPYFPKLDEFWGTPFHTEVIAFWIISAPAVAAASLRSG